MRARESKTEIAEKMRGHMQWLCERIGPCPPWSEAYYLKTRVGIHVVYRS